MTPEELRREYAGRDVDGDLGYTMHVTTVSKLLKEKDRQINHFKHSNEKLREIANSLKDANVDLVEENWRLSDELARARQEAEYLALTIYNKEYKDKPDAVPFELLDTVAGVITQIDNMYTGVRNERDQLRQKAQEK